ncbi:MAG: hypothetical protein HYU87_09440 [Chloroflexi bacterium]|nr:hypothetical protein [Chloroflexota bacterium]
MKRVSSFFTLRVPRRVLVAVVVVLAGASAYAYQEGVPPFGPSADTWHGVFLTNGQAYFGRLHSPPGEYATLREVYYVLATQIQPQDPKEAATPPQLTLQRLGAEIHGPKQEMRIPKTAILFVEELRGDSKLVEAIRLQKGGK